VLQNNHGDNLSVPDGATSFTFATPVALGGNYDVTVSNQPPFQNCVVSSASGAVNGPVTTVSIGCTVVTPTITTLASGSATGVALPLAVGLSPNGQVSFINQVWALQDSDTDVEDLDVLLSDGGIASLTGGNTGLNAGLAVDASGNIFATTTQYGCLVSEWPGGSNAVTCVNDSIEPNSYIAADTYYVAFDAAQNLYVDDVNGGVILKAPAGNLATATPYASGLTNPSGLVLDPAGNVYVFVTGFGGYIQKITPDGGLIELTPPDPGYFASGSGTVGVGAGGHQLAIDQFGNLYVADSGNSAIKLVSPTGLSFTLSSNFSSPAGVAVNPTGTMVYVADTGNNAIKLMTP
jgi:sugar lactone lactonase YvrE